MLAMIRDMLRYFRYEIEWIKHLEVAADATFESLLTGFGKGPAFAMLGFIGDVVGPVSFIILSRLNGHRGCIAS